MNSKLLKSYTGDLHSIKLKPKVTYLQQTPFCSAHHLLLRVHQNAECISIEFIL